ncbi:hypothetical protein A2331_01545 [Candidatus Falkowbacteria bacterium RIFOXYB2_FULL_34_18]|uniref:8-oxo-dGTP diphosphatase n=1 Tax=Candidatus Falkowbacteria bacterium RIFOXYD2_FULL_34_120 TaxID=1798007 RepID=A0A1F5TPM5_9BACT|nr:MAG: hypothetical protein A2331_01545 [Candidatus Falkowbacteria bacterium RIFOXYB2_FULL_34_18]OGF29299.1 MAG: hypothetical protein A2500_05425 [Candidatus Falkowbacteria bacterium RIFOXYC12_FULL_34_55]OGF36415.1 MAG: hypothetical protein A2466_01085 [Candidatus Falkowbacteria bacterium RIFOXYC2_FULL_34_220]OGF38894.1 MAG: hypothetical protein A2515_05845 [Candidatus Falkowbacteria bacterium RIFOXYD12_FULL_34_57]OGF40913.1 MAG: hypothetical protein A2531_04070 [Candidatus Falkowbacteria bact
MTHVVVGIIIKNTKPESYLLVSSIKDFGKYTGYYYPVGGHVDEGEGELGALKRETKEELNVNIIKAKKIVDTDSDIKNQKTSWYLCEIDSYNFNIDSRELKDVGFFTKEEMGKMNIWPATKKIFKKYIFNKN